MDIPVGPGRGSGAGSLVAYATDHHRHRSAALLAAVRALPQSRPRVDARLRHRLLPGPPRRGDPLRAAEIRPRPGRPDHHLRNAAGARRAARRRPRAADALWPGRPAVQDGAAEPGQPGDARPRRSTTSRALPRRPSSEPIVQTLLDMAQKLEGLYRHASTHAAGIVIGDRPLSELVPMYRDPRSDMPVTQFNMKYVEQAGLVKFDFLGLKTLTVLDTRGQADPPARHRDRSCAIPLDDQKTYAMLSRGEVVGVFQVESAGMRKALIGMRPDRIEDIIALVALYRPGPMENIPTYNARKHGEEEIASIHPKIDHLVAGDARRHRLPGTGDADRAGAVRLFARRSRSAAPRHGQEDPRRDGPAARALRRSAPSSAAVGKPQADFIFDLLAKFADYGFNKSHAAAYAVVSYQTAYLKAHYPVEFLAASMTLDMSNTDKLADFRQDAMRLGIDVVPPSVMTVFRDFEVGENRIFYSLAAIKGVGDAAVEHIVAKRRRKPVFKPRRFLRAHRSQGRRQARFRKPDHGRRVRLLRPRPRLADGRRRADDGACAPARSRTPLLASRTFSAIRWAASPQTLNLPARRSMAAGRAAASGIPGGRVFTSRRIRWMNTSPLCRRCACRPGPNSRPR